MNTFSFIVGYCHIQILTFRTSISDTLLLHAYNVLEQGKGSCSPQAENNYLCDLSCNENWNETFLGMIINSSSLTIGTSIGEGKADEINLALHIMTLYLKESLELYTLGCCTLVKVNLTQRLL